MTKRLLVALALCAVLVGGAQAATIFERLGTPITTWTIGDIGNQILATSWFQDFNSTNNIITVFGVQPAGATSIRFDLMKSSPTGTLVSFADVTLDPNNGSGNYAIFDIPNLNPGDYYIVASILGADEGIAATWAGLDPTDVSFQEVTDFAGHAGAGPEAFASVATSGVFIFDTALDLGFSVTGTQIPIPEPATCGLLVMGLGLAALNRKRLTRRS